MTEEKKPAEFLIDQTVRHRLLASAAKLIARKGYASTTVREIVEAAGVTKPVLYYYFPNKEGIYLEMMRGAWGRFDALLEGARKEFGGVKDRVLRLADRVFGQFLSQIEVARVGYSIYYGPPKGPLFLILTLFMPNSMR